MKQVLPTLVLGVLSGACTDVRDPLEGTQSLRITIRTPTDLGSVDARLADTARAVTFDVEAFDARGEIDETFDRPVNVYAQFLGTITPAFGQMPLATVAMTAGVGSNQTVTLPASVLGPTTLWFDDGAGLGPAYEFGAVAGTSPTLWYRDPFIQDLQKPRDEAAIDALSLTPLTDKQIAVDASRHGDRGRLVITSTYAQGYTLTDVLCADAAGTPACTAGAYGPVPVFTFPAPRPPLGPPLVVGRTVNRFTGGLSEFNGLTEVGFPRTYASDPVEVDAARVPAPVPFDVAWFGPLSSATGMINFERNESAAISITNGFVCPLGETYTTYKQWQIDPTGTGDSCGGKNVISVITQGTDFTTDPATLVGTNLTRIVGIVRPVNIGSFNVWIIFPRGASDVTL